MSEGDGSLKTLDLAEFGSCFELGLALREAGRK